jgi:hypothetical protein
MEGNKSFIEPKPFTFPQGSCAPMVRASLHQPVAGCPAVFLHHGTQPRQGKCHEGGKTGKMKGIGPRRRVVSKPEVGFQRENPAE